MTPAMSMRPTLMACDDDHGVLHLVGALADEAGYDVVAEVSSALDLTALLRVVQADVVVLDLALRGLSGLEILPELRAALPSSSLIVFTGFDDSDGELLRAGADIVIHKPRFDLLENELRGLRNGLPGADTAGNGATAEE